MVDPSGQNYSWTEIHKLLWEEQVLIVTAEGREPLA
jgi:hypothetical protein